MVQALATVMGRTASGTSKCSLVSAVRMVLHREHMGDIEREREGAQSCGRETGGQVSGKGHGVPGTREWEVWDSRIILRHHFFRVSILRICLVVEFNLNSYLNQ